MHLQLISFNKYMCLNRMKVTVLPMVLSWSEDWKEWMDI